MLVSLRIRSSHHRRRLDHANFGLGTPGSVDTVVPGIAGAIEDVVMGVEDAVGQPTLAEELPDVVDKG